MGHGRPSDHPFVVVFVEMVAAVAETKRVVDWIQPLTMAGTDKHFDCQLKPLVERTTFEDVFDLDSFLLVGRTSVIDCSYS